MSIEYPTEKGSVYIEDNGVWHHSKNRQKTLLERAMKVSRSTLEDVLSDYNLKKGDIVPREKADKLFEDLKQENIDLGEDYRICFLYKHGEHLRLGYSSELVYGNGSSFGDLNLPDNEKFKKDS